MGHALPSSTQSLSERLARAPRWGAAYRASRRDAASEQAALRVDVGSGLATIHHLDVRPERRP